MVLVAGARRRSPGVLAGHVVEHQVDDETDPPSTQPGRQVTQVLDGAQVGADRPVVLHGVATVVVALTGLEQRHQVQVGDPEVLEVVEALLDPGQVAGEAVGVAGIAEPVGLLDPVGPQQPALVEVVQVVGAYGEAARGDHDQPGRHRLGAARVKVEHGGVQVRPPPLQPGAEGRDPMGRDVGAGQLVERCGRDAVGQWWGDHRPTPLRPSPSRGAT